VRLPGRRLESSKSLMPGERAALRGMLSDAFREFRHQKARALWGLYATGPRTERGRARISKAQRRRWHAYRALKLKKDCLPIDRLGASAGYEKIVYQR
jgi:hypothetical protein